MAEPTTGPADAAGDRADVAARPFGDVLADAAGEPGRRKGERTRLRLMSAVAALLRDRLVHALRVTDVAAGAGVSPGTFYLYFPDKTEAAAHTLTAFAHHVFERMEAASASAADLPASVHTTTLAYVRVFEQNPGLFRALMQMTAESARFEAIYRELNARWNRRTARAIARREGAGEIPPGDALPTAYALGGMVDEFLANLYVRRDPALTARIRSPGDAAALLAGIWLRAVRPDGERAQG